LRQALPRCHVGDLRRRLLYIGRGGFGGQDTPEEQRSKPIATVGTTQITADSINDAVNRQIDQFQQRMPGRAVDPMMLASVTSGVLSQEVEGALTMYLAKQKGADFSDQAVLKALHEDATQQLEMLKMQTMYGGQLKQGATDKDFEAFVKSQTGMTWKEFQAKRLAEIDTNLKDPNQKDKLAEEASRSLLLQALKKSTAPSDEELKKNYDTLNFKRILFPKTAASQATTVLADLKANKMTF